MATKNWRQLKKRRWDRFSSYDTLSTQLIMPFLWPKSQWHDSIRYVYTIFTIEIVLYDSLSLNHRHFPSRTKKPIACFKVLLTPLKDGRLIELQSMQVFYERNQPFQTRTLACPNWRYLLHTMYTIICLWNQKSRDKIFPRTFWSLQTVPSWFSWHHSTAEQEIVQKWVAELENTDNWRSKSFLWLESKACIRLHVVLQRWNNISCCTHTRVI